MAGFVGKAIKGLGLLGRSVAGKKAAGKTRKIIKTYTTGRRQTEYVRPGHPTFKMKPKMGKKKGSQGILFRENYPQEKSSSQLKFRFSYPHKTPHVNLKTGPLKSSEKAIKKSEVK